MEMDLVHAHAVDRAFGLRYAVVHREHVGAHRFRYLQAADDRRHVGGGAVSVRMLMIMPVLVVMFVVMAVFVFVFVVMFMFMTVLLALLFSADKDVQMRYVNTIKQELRANNALKINYAAGKKVVNN